MKTRHVAVFALSVLPTIALAQRMVRSEEKPSTAPAATRSEAENAISERKPGSVRNRAQADRFQRVALALNLSIRQKRSVAVLIQNARKELAVTRANTNLTPAQQQQATGMIRLATAQKFVGLLTPEQKTDLTALLLKRKQQNSNSNSSSSGSGASPSAPDVPSVDAPSAGDAGNAEASTSSADASSADTATASNTTVADNQAATTPATPAAVQPAVAKSEPPSSAGTTPNSGHLSDAQLAAILNSFVQDENTDSAAKPSAQPVATSSS